MQLLQNQKIQSINLKINIIDFKNYYSLYILVSILSFLIHLPILLLNHLDYGTLLFANQLSFIYILLSVISSITMLYCLNNLNIMCVENKLGKIIFSLAYSACSFSMVQFDKVTYAIFFCILPIIYINFQKMFLYKGTLIYTILLAFSFIICPSATLTLLIILFIIVLLQIRTDKYSLFSDIVHFFVASITSFLLSAMCSFPYICNRLSDNQYDYPGFNFNMSISFFFSRFLPGAVSASAFATLKSFNIYYGLAGIFFIISYFFNRSVSKSSKSKNFILLLIFIGILMISPIQYIAEFFSYININGIYYSFIITFFLIILAYKGFSVYSEISIKDWLLTTLLFVFFVCFGYIGAKQNFHSLSLPSIVIFTTIELILFFTYRFKPFRTINILITFVIFLELTCNALLISFQDYFPHNMDETCTNQLEIAISDLFNKIYTNASSQENKNNLSIVQTESTEGERFINNNIDTTTNSDNYASNYLAFNESYYDQELTDLLSELEDVIVEDQKSSINTALLNNFELANHYCKLLGIASPLFEENTNVTFKFPQSNNYTITSNGNNIFFIKQTDSTADIGWTYFPYEINNIDQNTCINVDVTNAIYHFPSNTESLTGYTISYLMKEKGTRFKINAYYLNEDVLNELSNIIDNYQLTQKNTINYHNYYIGIALSCLGLLILLCFILNKDKSSLINQLRLIKDKITVSHYFKHINLFLFKNRYYFITFIIPFGLHLIVMILFDIMPFGNYALLDGDGALSVFPFLYDEVKNFRKFNFIYSTSGSYMGYNMFPARIMYYIIALFIPETKIALFYHFALPILYGLSSANMALYLSKKESSKEKCPNALILIPSLMYGLCSFMLIMHDYLQWYFILAALPLLALALDHLIYQKKRIIYILLLTFCMLNGIDYAYYICILLILLFFIADFRSLKEFILSGIRFAGASILSALNAFIFIYGMFFSRTGSGYESTDKIFPSFGFFGSFWEELKQHMFLSLSSSVSYNDNNITLYASVLAVILLILFLSSNMINRGKKIKLSLILVFLYLSFNENLLTYIINGFHYQSSCPNRHAILAVFILSLIAHDALTIIQTVSSKVILASCVLVIIFFSFCQYLSSGNSIVSYTLTIVLTLIYLFFLISYRKNTRVLYKCILSLFIAEMGINMIFLMSIYKSTAFNELFSNYDTFDDVISKNLPTEGSKYRTLFPSSEIINSGLIYSTNSTDYFSPNIPSAQLNLHHLFGEKCGTNFQIQDYASTPITNSIFGVKYIFVPTYTETALCDLTEYKYIGYANNYYIFENQNVLPFVQYAPLEIKDVVTNEYVPFQINDIVNSYLPNEDNIMSTNYLVYSETNVNTDSDCIGTYHFEDNEGNIISYDDAYNILNAWDDITLCTQFVVKIHFKSNTNGMSYIYAGQYVPIGNLTSGKEYEYTFHISNIIESKYYLLCTINDSVFKDYITKIKSQPIADLTVQDNIISGTVNYIKDSYTVLYLPASTGWKAYIDDKEVEIESPADSYMLIKTPKGKHTLKLEYKRDYKIALIITAFGWFATLSICLFSLYKKKIHS